MVWEVSKLTAAQRKIYSNVAQEVMEQWMMQELATRSSRVRSQRRPTDSSLSMAVEFARSRMYRLIEQKLVLAALSIKLESFGGKYFSCDGEQT